MKEKNIQIDVTVYEKEPYIHTFIGMIDVGAGLKFGLILFGIIFAPVVLFLLGMLIYAFF